MVHGHKFVKLKLVNHQKLAKINLLQNYQLYSKIQYLLVISLQYILLYCIILINELMRGGNPINYTHTINNNIYGIYTTDLTQYSNVIKLY